MSLREDLAMELIKVTTHYLRVDQALELADECLRQMEWARENCCHQSREKPIYAPIGGMENEGSAFTGQFYTETLIRDLTLAPKDWNPTPR